MPTTSFADKTDAGTAIDGLQHRPLAVHRDHRGSFAEVFCDHWALPIQPVQWSVVASAARSLRGMHLHRRHDEYISVLKGRGCVGLYDFRPDSPTYGNATLIELDGATPTCLSFPRGIIHGWYFHEESLHLQAVSESYSDYGPDDNHGCHWSYPALGIDWPDPDPLLSERAAGFPTLAALRRQFDFPAP
ncbi:MAG: dTDP-4-dehydrorhamnose 3,5-epimerase family protein [Gammaproteobacteria bacterium]|jgi:dTDP-4-dehydrorhamnose 3,5-epimerase